MRFVCAVIGILAAVLTGCSLHIDYDTVLLRNSSQWTDDDCRTVILTSAANNLKDQQSPVRLFAVPFTPNVLTALTRLDQMKKHWAADEYMKNLEEQIAIIAGVLYENKSDQYYDAKGNYLSSPSQLERLVLYVNCENKSWPCANPVLILGESPGGGAGYMTTLWGANMSNIPCPIPDITDLEKNIVLENDAHDVLKAVSVSGKRRNMLTTPENLIVIFTLKEGEKSFLEGTKTFTLVIAGMGDPVRFTYPLDILR